MRREPLPADALDETDRHLINLLQEGFPLTHRPFEEVGQRVGIGESEVIERLLNLRSIGAITRFGPFLDASAMGGAFCLCAMAVPQEQFEDVMTLVNAHDEVAHNYERDHELNMWFVLACENKADIGKMANLIEKETGLQVLQFPKLREFFIGFKVSA